MIKILDYVNPLSFFIAFCIGIFVVYISTPEPKVIFKYPTPDNVDKNVYKDHSDTCYKYEATEVKCSEDAIKNDLQYIEEEKKKKKPLGLFGTLKSKFFKSN